MDIVSYPILGYQQKKDLIKRNYNEIYAHELAHKQAGDSLAGSIVIEKNSEGVPIGGHVDIKMPLIDKNNPQKAIKDADTVIKSAMAPKDPSAQDYKVANSARTIKKEAETVQNKKRLDYYA